MIDDIRPVLMRMAGRYRRKAGLPWQWRDDHCHDLVIGAMRAFDRYRNLDDDSLRRVMVRAAHNRSRDAVRRAIATAQAAPPIERTDQIDVVAARDDAAQATEAFDAAEWFAVLSRRAGLSADDVAIVQERMRGLDVREIAATIGLSERTVYRRMASIRDRIGACMAGEA
jgi:RNA polymerase sigma factor (sigma-70 family)